jgi:hypothetical protein
MLLTDGADELHTPPLTASNRPLLLPAHTVPMPVMPAGAGFTVTGSVVKQPVTGNV